MAFFEDDEDLLREARDRVRDLDEKARAQDAENRAIADEMVDMAQEFYARMEGFGTEPTEEELYPTGHAGWYVNREGDFYSISHSSGVQDGPPKPVMVFRRGLAASLAPVRDAMQDAMSGMLRHAAVGWVRREEA